MRLLISIFLVLTMTACQLDSSDRLHTLEFQTMKVFPQPLPLRDIELIDKKGKTVNFSDLAGNYSVLFFGFTHCPDICPTTLLDMKKINKNLIQSNHAQPNFVFISVDPERDTPDVLNEYINYFNSDFKAYTADADNLKKLAAQLGVAYQVEAHEPDNKIYQVDHTAAWFVLNQEAQRIGIFTTPHHVDGITADLELLMQ